MTIRTHVSHMLAKAMQAGRIHQVRGCMVHVVDQAAIDTGHMYNVCLLYTSPSPRDATLSRMPSSA